MRNFTLSFILFLIFSNSNSQDLPYAKYALQKLTSKEFSGRGYVNDGGIKAARFIASQFDSLGLKQSAPDFFQPFTFPVNTFPGENEVFVDGKKLVPGDDYLVYPYSGGSALKKYKLKKMEQYSSAKAFNKNPDVCYIVLQDSLTENNRAKLFGDLISGVIKSGAIILLQQKKLTWSVAKGHYSIPVISVLQYYVPENSKDVSISVSQEFIPEFKTQNVGAYIPGASLPDSFIVFTAHYDHLGMMGLHTMFPGANDNASGVAMLLNLASHFSKKENQPACSIVFIAFAGEEAGLVGSKYFTEHPLFNLSKIKFLINLDLLGTGEEGMMVVNATEFPQQFQLLDSLNNQGKYLVKLGQRGKAKNSDHYYFSEAGVPSFFFYTMGGIQAYHDINDKAETLPLTEFEDVFRLSIDFTKHLR
jgi:aminopeptidase YwaD